MARKKRGHGEGEHGADESWLLPYSDMMTLLLALFIVLFAASNIDKDKYQSIMEAFAGEIGVIGGPSGSLPGGSSYIPVIPPDPPEDPDPGEIGGIDDLDPELYMLYNSIDLYRSENGLEDSLGLKVVDGGIALTLSSDIWFASGSAELNDKMRDMAKKLSDLLVANQEHPLSLNAIVTGHTDNRPINTQQYPTNWHLSVYRASNFVIEMQKNPDLDPRIFSIRGAGEWEPIASNNTEAGMQANRRVEVMITLNSEKPE